MVESLLLAVTRVSMFRPWMPLGVHAARMDTTNRDADQDERLNLNCAWYADILTTLTEELQGETVKKPISG